VEEWHERALLARQLLDPGNGQCTVRWRAGSGCSGSGPDPGGTAGCVERKVTFAADTLFDFDKAVLKPEGKAKLDDLVSKLQGITLEVIIAVGHTDSFGSDKYNDRLSIRRAESVKAYLVSKGVEANRVYTEGKGKRQLKVDPKSCKGNRTAQIACQQPNRRVEVEVVGTRSAR
jgi:OOP family OmpA-OmpF porin